MQGKLQISHKNLIPVLVCMHFKIALNKPTSAPIITERHLGLQRKAYCGDNAPTGVW